MSWESLGCCCAGPPCCPQTSLLFTVTDAVVQFGSTSTFGGWRTQVTGDPLQITSVQLSPELLVPKVLDRKNSQFDQRCYFYYQQSYFGVPVVGGIMVSASNAQGARGGPWLDAGNNNPSYRAIWYAQPIRDPNPPYHALFWEAGLRIDFYAWTSIFGPPTTPYWGGGFVMARATPLGSSCPVNRTWQNGTLSPLFPLLGQVNAGETVPSPSGSGFNNIHTSQGYQSIQPPTNFEFTIT